MPLQHPHPRIYENTMIVLHQWWRQVTRTNLRMVLATCFVTSVCINLSTVDIRPLLRRTTNLSQLIFTEGKAVVPRQTHQTDDDRLMVAALEASLREAELSDPHADCVPIRIGDVYTDEQKNKVLGVTSANASDPWHQFVLSIDNCHLYSDYEGIVTHIMNDMKTMKIVAVQSFLKASQMKFLVTFENGHQALLKPSRGPRETESPLHIYVMDDLERSIAEIAAFQLDRLLGLRRAVPTVGRVVDLWHELRPVANPTLRRTFYVSPAGNVCTTGECYEHCDRQHPVCGAPTKVEVSLQMLLPTNAFFSKAHNDAPYRGCYCGTLHKVKWQADRNYCNACLKKQRDIVNGTRLINIVDLGILDFIAGNWDRHTHTTMRLWQRLRPPMANALDAFILTQDQGRAFGKPQHDNVDLLEPVRQCCVVHPRTLRALLDMFVGTSLSLRMRHAMSADPTYPVLADKHYASLDRRVRLVLQAVHLCLQTHRGSNAVIRRWYYNPMMTAWYKMTFKQGDILSQQRCMF